VDNGNGFFCLSVCHSLAGLPLITILLIPMWTKSAPAGLLASAVIIFTLPSASNPNSQLSTKVAGLKKLSFNNLRRIDYVGVGLLLAASILLVFAFESAGIEYGWNSVTIIVTLILGFAIFMGFIIWEIWLQQRPDQIPEPIFPPRILKSRLMASMFAYVPDSLIIPH
jgi:hypothetical protein